MRSPWPEAEVQLLREHYPHRRAVDIAAMLGCEIKRVYAKAHQLGLRKSDEFLQQHAARYASGQTGSEATQFQRGHKTWNAGKKGWTSGGRSAETRFKPGRPAHEARNYLPIGSKRITRDGLLERKMTDDPSIVPARRWVGVHRLVWESAHGPIPSGHAVVFRAGRHTTDEAAITVDALEMVTRVELMRRNSYHNRYPKEVGLAIQARGALMRKINRLSRAQHGETP